MRKKKLNIIRPALSVERMQDGVLIPRLNAVYDGVYKHDAYTNVPVPAPVFRSAIDALSTAVTAALDGGKSALLERDHRRAEAVTLYRSIGHYVEVACQGDMLTFVASGFLPVSPTRTKATDPVAVPSILAIDQGSTGQLLVNIQGVANARTYEVRYASVPSAGDTLNWTTKLVATARPAVAINGLTRGTNYAVQVRAFGKAGYSDWSVPAERMVI